MSEFPLEEPSSTDTLDRVPATFFLAASWVLVFALMAYAQGRLHINAGNWVAGGIKAAIASQFGSLNTQAVFDGQFHRTLTATFIHFSLLHLIINTVVFYQLGRSIEPWYGSGQFLLLYVLLGVGSNTLATLLRPLLGQSALVQSGGGSGVICGLIGLLAVVGWRERSRLGDSMLMQMGIQLIIIGIMGMFIPNVDNLVHACGALTGALVGLADPLLMRWNGSKVSASLVTCCFLLAIGSIHSQIDYNRNDFRQLTNSRQQDQILRNQLLRTIMVEPIFLRISSSARTLTTETGNPGYNLVERDRQTLLTNLQQADLLEDQTHAIQKDPRIPLAFWHDLAHVALSKRPTPNQISQFRGIQILLLGRIEYLMHVNIAIHDRLAARIGLRSRLRAIPATTQQAVLPPNIYPTEVNKP